MAVIVVRGTGDVGSAVASLLFCAGHRVVLHDASTSSHTRRGMAFVDALYQETAKLEGLLAKRARTLQDLPFMLRCRRAVPISDAPLEQVVAQVQPQVVVDARMRKHDQPEAQRGLAPLTIGLGPNFEAGNNVDIAIETKWGDELGAVIREGTTRVLAGEPQPNDGHARERYVYAPAAGTFSTPFNIGDAVEQGQEIACIGETPVYAPLSGCLRGIAHDGATVGKGSKIIEVDPRGAARSAHGLGERPRRIAEGVLKAIEEKPTSTGMSRGGAAAFSGGAVIGALGGLIGLGGAEFRLPLLIGSFRFAALEAVILNKAMSLVVVAAALLFRANTIPLSEVVGHWPVIINLLAGSLAGAWFAAGWATRMRASMLYRVIAVLLVLIAGVLMFGHESATKGVPALSGAALMLAGIVTGFGIGVVASFLGVAGGELLIPTLILLFGMEIKVAGSLSLAVSLPTMLVSFARYSRDSSFQVLDRNRHFVVVMAAGSLAGAFIGGNLLDLIPSFVLLPLLSIILLLSAAKIWRHKN